MVEQGNIIAHLGEPELLFQKCGYCISNYLPFEHRDIYLIRMWKNFLDA